MKAYKHCTKDIINRHAQLQDDRCGEYGYYLIFLASLDLKINRNINIIKNDKVMCLLCSTGCI
jgi:hypothetical protein